MNHEIWFRILQVAVIAPFIYTVSEKQNGYFKLGLKLVAGAIVVQNIVPLYEEMKPLIEAAYKLQQEKTQIVKAGAIDAEFTETDKTTS